MKYVGPKSFEAMQVSGKRKRTFPTGLSGDPTVKALSNPDQPLCYHQTHDQQPEDGGEGCDEQQAFELDSKTMAEAVDMKRLKTRDDVVVGKGKKDKISEARIEQLKKRGLLVLE